MADAVEQVVKFLPDIMVNPAAHVAPVGASPYFEEVLGKMREAVTKTEGSDPFSAFRRSTEVNIAPIDASRSILEQMGNLAGGAPAIPLAHAERAMFNNYTDMATLLAQVKTKHDFDTMPATRAGKVLILDTLIDHLNGYPAFQAKLRTMNVAQRRVFAQALITDDVIKSMRTKLDLEMKKPTAWGAQREVPAITTDLTTRKTKVNTAVAAILPARGGGAFAINDDKLKQTTLPEAANFRYFNLSMLDPAAPANLSVQSIYEDWFTNYEAAFSAAEAARLGRALNANELRAVRTAAEQRATNDVNGLFTDLQEAKRVAGLEDAKVAEVKKRKSDFKGALDTLAGEALATSIERVVTAAETDLRTKLEEAKTEDEAKSQTVLDVIDTAWKKKHTGKDGITTTSIDKREVRRLKKVLFEDGTHGLFAWALSQSDVTPEQIAAINRMMRDDPNNPRLKEIETTVGSLVMRDYFRSGGRMSEKQMDRLANSNQETLVNIIKNGLSKVDGARKQVKDVFGEEIARFLEKPGFGARLKEKFTGKRLIALLAIALGIGAVGYLVAPAGFILQSLSMAGLVNAPGAIALGAEAARGAVSVAAISGMESAATFLIPGASSVSILPATATAANAVSAGTATALGTAGIIGTVKVVNAARGK